MSTDTGAKAIVPYGPRQLPYGPEPPELTPEKLDYKLCNGFGLTQYKFISDYDKEPLQCQMPEAAISEAEINPIKVRTVRKMEHLIPVPVVAVSNESESMVQFNQQSVSQMNMNINIEDYFRFLKAQGIPVLPGTKELPEVKSFLPPLKLLQPNAPINSELQVASLSESDAESRLTKTSILPDDETSPYAAKGEMAIYSENGTDFQQISFVPSGQGQEVILLFPVSMPRAAVLMPQKPEEFAQSFIYMLGLKDKMNEATKDTKWRNKLSSLLFKCIMSLVLGYLYNHVKSYITNFATLTSQDSAEADNLAMLIIQTEIDAGTFDATDYKNLAARLDFLKTLFMKQGIASPALKSYFGIPLTATTEAGILDEHYETIFEMVYRLGQMPIELGASKWSYASILQNVCSKIYIILLNYDVITAAISDKAAPIINAIIDLKASDSDIFKRLKSIIVLGVAYNSYGWLFALVAPFAIPAAIGVSNWAICTLARLPFKAIKYAGNSAIGIAKFLVSDDKQSQSNPFTPGQDGSLICVGHTRIATGELVPYMVSMNDIHALSHELQHAKLENASLLSSLFDASGAAGLDMQSHTFNKNALRIFKETHPIGNLIKCIDSEIIALTNADEYGVVKNFPEIAFSVFFNTICKDEDAKNGLLIGPVIQFCAETLHEAISGVRSGIIGTIGAIIKEGLLGEGATQFSNGSDDESTVLSCKSFTSVSSYESFNTAKTGNSLSFLQITAETDDTNTVDTTQQIIIDLTFKMKDSLKKRLKQSEKNGLTNLPQQPCLTKSNSNISSVSGSDSSVSGSDSSVSVSGSDSSNDAVTISTITNDSDSPKTDNSANFHQTVLEIKFAKMETQILHRRVQDLQDLQDESSALIEEIKLSLLKPHTDLIVFSVIDWIAGLTVSAAEKVGIMKAGYKRHRNVPILAEIKQKIVKTGTGLFNAIKPRLVRVKGRKSKRFAPKKGTKKWRKRYGSRRGTKKVYRKRYNTHKKRK